MIRNKRFILPPSAFILSLFLVVSACTAGRQVPDALATRPAPGPGTVTAMPVSSTPPATALPAAAAAATQPSPAGTGIARRLTPDAALLARRCPPNATPSQSGLGDQLFPNLGNGGYHVGHYNLDLAVDMAAQTINGTATLSALALQNLPAFDLDFSGLTIHALSVNGRLAQYARTAGELVITPTLPLTAAQPFTVSVSYGGTPVPMRDPGDPIPTGWLFAADGAYVASEPAAAHTWYPGNDHPCDKATYAFRITVPQPYVVAANGLLKSKTDQGGTSTYVYEARDPIASYLVTVDIAKFVTQTQTGPGGLSIRNFFAPDLAGDAEAAFKRTPDIIAFYNSRFGPYPFEVYGVVVATAGNGFALEDQTLTLFAHDFVGAPEETENVAAHELAHQWFGDSVSLTDWQDIWLNEGFATYASDLWQEHLHGAQALDQIIRDTYSYVDRHHLPPPGAPPANNLFNGGIYDRGALTLHALRVRVGDDVFFRILRTYTDHYRYANAGTADFIAVAQEVSRQDLKQFFQDWLYSPDLPSIPQMGLNPSATP